MSDHENKEPCNCWESDCDECNQRVADQAAESEMGEHLLAIEVQEESEFQRQIEGGDEDDNDEEDMHGSRPIDEADEDEEEEEEEEEEEDEKDGEESK